MELTGCRCTGTELSPHANPKLLLAPALRDSPDSPVCECCVCPWVLTASLHGGAVLGLCLHPLPVAAERSPHPARQHRVEGFGITMATAR